MLVEQVFTTDVIAISALIMSVISGILSLLSISHSHDSWKFIHQVELLIENIKNSTTQEERFMAMNKLERFHKEHSGRQS